MSGEEHSSPPSAMGEPSFKTPKDILFFVLSVLWIFPSIGAGWIIAGGFEKLGEARSVVAFFASLKLEQWMAFLLLALHGFFIFLAIHFQREARRKSAADILSAETEA